MGVSHVAWVNNEDAPNSILAAWSKTNNCINEGKSRPNGKDPTDHPIAGHGNDPKGNCGHDHGANGLRDPEEWVVDRPFRVHSLAIVSFTYF